MYGSKSFVGRKRYPFEPQVLFFVWFCSGVFNSLCSFYLIHFPPKSSTSSASASATLSLLVSLSLSLFSLFSLSLLVSRSLNMAMIKQILILRVKTNRQKDKHEGTAQHRTEQHEYIARIARIPHSQRETRESQGERDKGRERQSRLKRKNTEIHHKR